MLERLSKWWELDRERSEHTREFGFTTDIRLLCIAVILWVFTVVGYALHWKMTMLGFSALILCTVTVSCSFHMKALLASLFLLWTLVALQAINIDMRDHFHSSDLINTMQGQSVRIHGTVSKSKLIDAQGTQLVELTADEISVQDYDGKLTRRVTLFSDQRTQVGDVIEAIGELKIEGPQVQIDQAFLRIEQSQTDEIATFKQTMRDKLSRQTGENETALILGLAYGDDSLMDDAASNNFKITGLTHLTAVSGSNITLMFMLVYRCGMYFRVERKTLIVVATVSTLIYACFVGSEGSVIRAWTMGMIASIGLILGHGRQSISLISSALIILLIYDPELSFNLGFVLSAIATLSLILLAPCIIRLLTLWIPQVASELIAIPAAATLWCSPVIYMLQESISLYSVPANIFAVPLVPILTVTGLILALIYYFQIEVVDHVFVIISDILASILLGIATFFSSLPFSAVSIEYSTKHMLLILTLVVLISSSLIYTDFRIFGGTKNSVRSKVNNHEA